MELQLNGLPRGDLVAVSQQLFSLGASGLQEDHLPGEAPPPLQPWDTGPPPAATPRMVVRAWFEDPDAQRITAELAHVRAEILWSPVPDTDWEVAWRAGFTPIHIGDSLTVAPPWDAPEGALIIEPGQGFGTGSHPTTVQMLEAIVAHAPGLGTALDIGCGSGILALAAASLGLRAHGVDIETAAIADAMANATRNGLAVSFATTPIPELVTPADLVLANLHAELIVHFADDLVRLTGQRLILAGILVSREHTVRETLDDRLQLDTRRQVGDWVSLHYRAQT
jgi:ribosomal protein L11 methyltransferase